MAFDCVAIVSNFPHISIQNHTLSTERIAIQADTQKAFLAKFGHIMSSYVSRCHSPSYDKISPSGLEHTFLWSEKEMEADDENDHEVRA